MIRTLFLHKGLAESRARRPAGVEPTRVGKLALWGEGPGVEAIAQDCRAAGIDVGAPLEEVECVLVVSDSVWRSHAASGVPAAALVAVATATLPLDAVAARLGGAERIIGLHWPGPAAGARALELVRGARTSDGTLARALDLARQLRKTPTLQRDSPEPLSRACLHAYIAEGLRMLGEGAGAALIENSAAQAGMPCGPLALADRSGLAHVRAALPEAEAEGRRILDLMLDAWGRGGAASGGGFYADAAGGGRTALWPDLQRQFPARAPAAAAAALRDRLLFAQSLAAVRYWAAGLVDPVDADVASVLGWGFPSYTGGVLSYVDTVGLRGFIERCAALADRFGERFRAPSWLQDRARGGDRVYAP